MSADLAPVSLATLLLNSRTSPQTRTTYAAALRACAAFHGLADLHDLAQALFTGSHRDAQRMAARWRTHLVQSGQAPATVNKQLAALRSLVSLARAEGVVPWTLELPGIKARKYRDTSGPGEDAYAKILAACQTPAEHAVIRLMGDAGLRSIEVLRLDAGDLNQEAATLSVRGKGAFSEPTPVPVGPETLAAILALLAGRRTGPMLRARTGHGVEVEGRATRQTVRSIVEAVRKRSGVRFRPHGLRHRLGTVIAAQTGSVLTVRAALRHADVRTSMLYVDRAAVDLAKVMREVEG